ncbi:hypothetical protein LTR08_008278 [Meristemomyces frigidus]|nr:hypothetical protein LTR08_008278 [Meristemomyces frigidus]
MEHITTMRSISLPPPPQARKPAWAMLLQLPKELRLLIYDLLFEPLLVQRPEHFDTYVLPPEWPEWPAADYKNLRSVLLTCQQMRAEAQWHFETHYLPKLTVYFDNVPDLRHFAEKIAGLDVKYGDIQICLHDSLLIASRFNKISNMPAKRVQVQPRLERLAEEVRDFVQYQEAPKTSAEYAAMSRRTKKLMPWTTRPDSSSNTNDLIVRTTCYRADRRIEVITPIKPPRPGLKTSMHRICNTWHTDYVVVVGCVKLLQLPTQRLHPVAAGLCLLATKEYRGNLRTEESVEEARRRFSTIPSFLTPTE